MKTPRLSRHSKAHKGQGLVEVIAMIIFFVIMTSMVMSLSVYLYMQHAVVTAAREGARVASLNADLGGSSQQAGEDAVIAAVQNFMAQTTGQTLTDSQIDVTPPDPADPVGDRAVSVAVNYDFPSPIPIGSFLSGMGVSNDLDTISVNSLAIMRYEE